MVLPSSGATDAAAAQKIWNLETKDSLAKLQDDLLTPGAACRLREEPHGYKPLAVRVFIKRGRLVLLAAVAVTMVVAFALTFSGGVVIETFDRRAVSIQKQEKLVQTYNAYSGTVTAAIQRPLELFTALVVHVAVLRLMTNDVLATEKRWRVRGVVVVVSAIATYLLANGLSAVNVQTREQPVRLAITTKDLTAQTPDITTTSTVDKSFAESRPGNPVTNTILRDLLLPQAIETQLACYDADQMSGEDEVRYRIPSRAWQKHLIPTALEPKSMQFEVSASNTPANEALTTDQFPMNASLAAELLLYSSMDAKGSAWGEHNGFLDPQLATQLYLEHNRSEEPMSFAADYLDVPTTRITRLLPPTLATTERKDREWFIKHAAPTMHKVSNPDYKNASLRSWNMTLSHVDIEPGTLWVDAVTIEREMATPRLATNATNNTSTRYFAISATARGETIRTASKFIRKAGGAVDEGVELYSVCADRNGVDGSTSLIKKDDIYTRCTNRSASSLLVVSRGRRLVADTVIQNATIESSELVLGKGDGVIVNMREISSVTVARISWRLQNLSAIYNAKCNDIGGCMGLDVALPGSGQRLLVSASALPLAVAPPLIVEGNNSYDPLPLIFVRRPEAYIVNDFRDATVTGDILLPHNIGNINTSLLSHSKQASFHCLSKPMKRLARYINNHIYMESTLQPAYSAAAFFLLQGGVTHDILNQSWTTQRVLAFDGNTQDVDVVIFIPRLNVIFTLAGCVVLVLVVALVVLWSLLGKKESDPLAHITTPHTVANVLVNETTFPPLLLTRSVASSGDTVCEDNADDFVVESLTLKRKEGEYDGENDQLSER